MVLNRKKRMPVVSILLVVLLILCPLFCMPAFSQGGNVVVTINIKDYMLRPVPNASVIVDDIFVGVTDRDGLITVSNFSAGPHNITASAEGLATRMAEREFSDGAKVNVQLNRENVVTDPNIVTFIILDSGASKSKLAGATVYIDGELIGKTDTKDGKVQYLIPAGIHRVKVQKEGWQDNETVMEITPGATYTMYLSTAGKFSIFNLKLFLYALEKEITKGLLVTIQLSVVAMSIGLVIGLIMGLGRVSSNIVFRSVASVYVEGVRGLPILLQLLFVNFGLPFLISDITGGQFNIDGFTACVIALSVNSGAYMGEIFKAGIEAIHKGQMEAARSLGMTYNQSMRYIILPQAFKIVLPALGNEFIALIKDSSIGMVISVMEIVWWSKSIGAEYYNTFTPLLAAGMVYLCITIPLGRMVQYMEKRYNVNNARKQGTGILKKKPRAGGREPEGTV
ncbi:ABC transporter permease subunit [Methanocella conradii]|uniref:ABC transporter permease subunit n=1 Tax=Methanocella conradii TaxID=1175444 RepID=UPI00157C3B3C|nr:ABC transporter permease subunit [Methanocella conradii]MDI6897177.1 ABC transporter permease subunit [Methanocella conradii]